MSNRQLHQTIDNLPLALQKEVESYVAYLSFKNTQLATEKEVPIQKLPLKFGAGKGLIQYVADDWEKDLDQEFDIFNGTDR